MNAPKVLTKFTKYYDSMFSLEPKKAGIKISLSSEFNDVFDSQILLNDESIKIFALKYGMGREFVQFCLDSLSNFTHILSLIGNSAISMDTANMWGIYADNGKGVALEFDYEEMDNRANNTLVKKLAEQFYMYETEENSPQIKISKKIQYAKTQDGQKALKYIISGMSSADLNKDERTAINIINEKIYRNNIDQGLIQSIEPIVYEIFRIKDYQKALYKISYTDNYRHLLNGLEASLQKERLEYRKKTTNDNIEKEYINAQILFLETQFAYFHSTKSIIWQHENEHRLLIPYYVHKDFIRLCENYTELSDYKKQLDIFTKKNLKERYFCYYSNNSFEHSYDISHGSGAITLVNIPYPKKIFLGWNFTDQTKIDRIREFCKQFQIDLFQVECHFNHKTENEFLFRSISLD